MEERPGGGVATFSESRWKCKTATYRSAEIIHLTNNLNTNGSDNTFLEMKNTFNRGLISSLSC